MRRVEYVNITNIVYDKLPLNPSTLELIDFIRNNSIEDMPPIKLDLRPSGEFILKDGRHRLLAYKLLGISKIKGKFFKK